MMDTVEDQLDVADDFIDKIVEAAPEQMSAPAAAYVIKELLSLYNMEELSPFIFNLIMATQKLEMAEAEVRSRRGYMN